MENVLFRQSESDNPYPLYARMLAEQPVYRDESNGIWAVYSHAACTQVLQATTAAHIPAPQPAMLTHQLARLANPPAHPAFRQAAMDLMTRLQPAHIAALLARLLGASAEVDWVDTVCKKLPALAVLDGLGFGQEDIASILPQLEGLTKLMLPNKSAQQLAEANAVATDIHARVARHVAASGVAGDDNQQAIYVANLIGLLIQSYDAGRGLLSNALLQALTHGRHGDWPALVIETLRYDSPIHNTRRVLVEDMMLHGRTLSRGDAVLLVLAAANRDPAVFSHPHDFDPARCNNDAHLSFGGGIHHCAARHFSVKLAADALAALFAAGRKIRLLQPAMTYEPMINARLPRQLWIALGQ